MVLRLPRLGRERAGADDRRARAPRQVQVVLQVVDARQPVVEQLLGVKEVRQVRAAVARAALAGAAFLDGPRVVAVLRVGDVDAAGRARRAGRCARCASASRSRTCRCPRRSPSRCRRACPRPSGSAGDRPASRARARRSPRTSPPAASPTPRPPSARPSNGSAAISLQVRAPQVEVGAALHDAEAQLPGAPRGAARQRRAQRVVRAIAASIASRGASEGGHSSKAIAMSLPSGAWISMARSGVRRCSEPSRCERNVTPSSSMVRRSRRLNTWKPPESVRIAPRPAHEAVQAAQRARSARRPAAAPGDRCCPG